MRPEHQQTRQMQLAIRNGAEQDGKPLHQLGGAGAPRRGVLGKAQLVNAVGVKARAGPRAVQRSSCVALIRAFGPGNAF